MRTRTCWYIRGVAATWSQCACRPSAAELENSLMLTAGLVPCKPGKHTTLLVVFQPQEIRFQTGPSTTCRLASFMQMSTHLDKIEPTRPTLSPSSARPTIMYQKLNLVAPRSKVPSESAAAQSMLREGGPRQNHMTNVHSHSCSDRPFDSQPRVSAWTPREHRASDYESHVSGWVFQGVGPRKSARDPRMDLHLRIPAERWCITIKEFREFVADVNQAQCFFPGMLTPEL